MKLDEHTNRRTVARSEVELWVDEIDDDGAVYYQRATNLSLGGLFLDRTLPHPAGTRMTLCLTLPDDRDALRVEAEVVDAPREMGMGVRFVSITDAQRASLARYLKLT